MFCIAVHSSCFSPETHALRVIAADTNGLLQSRTRTSAWNQSFCWKSIYTAAVGTKHAGGL